MNRRPSSAEFDDQPPQPNAEVPDTQPPIALREPHDIGMNTSSGNNTSATQSPVMPKTSLLIRCFEVQIDRNLQGERHVGYSSIYSPGDADQTATSLPLGSTK